MYKDALDKVGIKMEVFKVGTFKSAVEPYILNKISDANKLQKQEYIDGLWSSILQGVSTERKINASMLRLIRGLLSSIVISMFRQSS